MFLIVLLVALMGCALFPTPASGTVPSRRDLFSTSTFSGFSGPFYPAIDQGGNVWVTNDTSNGVLKLNRTGSIMGSFSVGLYPYAIAIDESDNVWVTLDSDEGVVKFNNAGSVLLKVSLADPPSGIAFEPVYNVIWVAMRNIQAVSVISINGNVLGTYDLSPWGVEEPIAITVSNDGTGNVFVLNYNGGVYKLDYSGGLLASYAVGNFPGGMGVDSAGNLWAADTFNSIVTKISPSGSTLGTYAVAYPTGLAFDKSGNVWIGNNEGYEYSSGTVTEMSSTGVILSSYPVGSGAIGIVITGTDVWVGCSTTLTLLQFPATLAPTHRPTSSPTTPAPYVFDYSTPAPLSTSATIGILLGSIGGLLFVMLILFQGYRHRDSMMQWVQAHEQRRANNAGHSLFSSAPLPIAVVVAMPVQEPSIKDLHA